MVAFRTAILHFSFTKAKIQQLKTSLSELEEDDKEWSKNVEYCRRFN